MTVDGLTLGVTHVFPQPIDAVWALLTEVEQMAGLGPEHISATWDSTDRGLGAGFHGTNRRGERTWTVACVVVACTEPTGFAWSVGDPAEPFGIWSYDLQPRGTGTTVTHTFTHGRGISGITAAIAKFPDQEREIIAGRSAQLQDNMRIALASAERVLSSGRPG